MYLTIPAQTLVVLCYLSQFRLLVPAYNFEAYSTTKRCNEALPHSCFAAGAGMVPIRHHDFTASMGDGGRNRRWHLRRNDWLGLHPDLGLLLLGRRLVWSIVEVLRRGLVSHSNLYLVRDCTNSSQVNHSLEIATRPCLPKPLHWALAVPLRTAHAAEPTNTPVPTRL